MTVVKTWVLILYLAGMREGGPMMIDDMALEEQCRTMAAAVMKKHGDTNDYSSSGSWAECYSYDKLVRQ